MIQQDMLYKPSLNYIKKERFTGSFAGMRYMLEKKKTEEAESLLACAWEEPYAFDKTPEEKKIFKEFALTEDGLVEAWNWLDEMQEQLGTNKL
ncbi:MAG: hypothetical protein IJZ00_07120 [Lachnospiraceae bacterium]|nr:hypothetical protein [Lachnospiraceae bacterium]